MNEAINEMTAVRDLNRVDGFDPTKFMRRLTEPDANGQPIEKLYLDVAYRKLWFRLKHPEGAIRKFVKEITDNFAIVEARVYLDRNDPPDSYIANAIVKRYFNPEDKLGDKYLEIAETAAAGRALADAGFGIQFSDTSENPEPNVVDTPIGIPNGINVDSITGEVMPSSQTSAAPTPAVQNAPRTAPSAVQPPKPTYTAMSPVEEIMASMTVEEAINVTIDSGFYKGKTLGQVAQEKPQSLDWYVNQYRGSNNILRAAAKLLLEKASA